MQKAAGILRRYLGTTPDQPRKEQPAENSANACYSAGYVEYTPLDSNQ